MTREVRRVTAREGYDRWAETYDRTPNPVVAMDDRVTPAALRPAAGECIADVGCGTGRHAAAILAAGATCVGLDFSPEMLRVAAARCPRARFVEADLAHPLPLDDGSFDAALFALVAEHLDRLEPAARELHRILRPGGRLVMSVYHPSLAEAGSEANFEADGVEYRLGAVAWTIEDYVSALRAAGFVSIETSEHDGDEALARRVPQARKFVGRPILLLVAARRAG